MPMRTQVANEQALEATIAAAVVALAVAAVCRDVAYRAKITGSIGRKSRQAELDHLDNRAAGSGRFTRQGLHEGYQEQAKLPCNMQMCCSSRAGRTGGRCHAQAGDRPIHATARCWPPTARRSPSIGQFEPALDAIRRAQTPEYPDWKLDVGGRRHPRSGRPDKTRPGNFIARRSISSRTSPPCSPISACPMCWKGISRWLRPICARPREQPGADSRVRQNLALVVGLQGRFDEAEKIATRGIVARSGAGQHDLSRAA